MASLTPLTLLSVVALIYTLYRRYTRKSIAHIPGPQPESFLLGNLRELYQGQAGEADFKWQEEFGGVVRIKAPLGEDRLLVSDPKALQHIYQTAGYGFKKPPERRELTRMTMGRGLVWADGEDHKRHRKVMLPGFGSPESKAFLPIFRGCAEQYLDPKLTSKWKDVISGSSDQTVVFDVPNWLSRATLDAIGEAAFDYKFGAMENKENELSKSYTNLFADMFGAPPSPVIFFQSISYYLPMSILGALLDHGPGPRLARARYSEKVATGVARDLVNEKTAASMQGKGNNDIMSNLVRANHGENPRGKLREEEMLAQMRTIMLAGHETTANTLSWALLEIAKSSDIQAKLRHEIRATESAVHARGDSDLTAKDFDAMPYTIAVMKEVLRFHPVSYNNFRQAARDEIVPLSKPITTTTGEVLNEILIPEGTKIVTSIAGYNRNKDLWGEDAHTFRPERWMEGLKERKGPSVGVYGNLMTFASGLRSCIGWRFAVIELQAFLVELVGNFEFSLTAETEKVRREACLVMVPTLEGQVEKGAQLPLKVSIASRE